jgi:hypothetical protein
METPQLLQLTKPAAAVPGLAPVKLLLLNEPTVALQVWQGDSHTVEDILKARYVPKKPQEDAQCQASIQIDPLSDLVKKHIRETRLVPMRFTEVIDISEEDYRPQSHSAPGKSSDPSKFLTKADWIQPIKPEDPMKHYKETWEFQKCEKTAGNLEKEIQIQQEDFRKLAIQPHVIKEGKKGEEERKEEENKAETERAEALLRGNRELLAEVEELLAKRVQSEDPLDLVPIKEEPERPSIPTPVQPANSALTQRLTSAFDTASKAIHISSASKPLKATGRKLYKCKPK